MTKEAIEWRLVQDKPKYHLFMGCKSICGRQYSNGAFKVLIRPLVKDRCGHCSNILPKIIERLKDVS